MHPVQAKMLLTQTLNSQDLPTFLLIWLAPNFIEIKTIEWIHFVFIPNFRCEDVVVFQKCKTNFLEIMRQFLDGMWYVISFGEAC